MNRFLCLLPKPKPSIHEVPAPDTVNREKLQSLAECCYAITPLIAFREDPSALFLDIQQSLKLFSKNIDLKPEEVILQTCQALAQHHFIVFHRWAYAQRLSDALVEARWGVTTLQAPLQALYDFLFPLKLNADDARNVDTCLQSLEQLGFTTLADVFHLPAARISSHLGLLALQLHEALHGLSFDHLPPLELQEVVEETHHFDPSEAYQELEPLLFPLKTVSERVFHRLASRHQRLSRLEICLFLEATSASRHTTRQWTMGFSFAPSHGTQLHRSLRDFLLQQFHSEPLEHPVTGFSLRVLETTPWLTTQRDFFGRDDEEKEALMSLKDRIQQRNGVGSFFQVETIPSHQPEKAWLIQHEMTAKNTLPLEKQTHLSNPTMDSSQSLTAAFLQTLPERPTRLLKDPRLLIRIHSLLLDRTDNRSWRIQKWEGPERIVCHWWDENVARDYYRITTSDGCGLWVFSPIPSPHPNPHPVTSALSREERPPLYLHGFFD